MKKIHGGGNFGVISFFGFCLRMELLLVILTLGVVFLPQMVEIAHAAMKETEKFVAEKQSHAHGQT